MSWYKASLLKKGDVIRLPPLSGHPYHVEKILMNTPDERYITIVTQPLCNHNPDQLFRDPTIISTYSNVFILNEKDLKDHNNL